MLHNITLPVSPSLCPRCGFNRIQLEPEGATASCRRCHTTISAYRRASPLKHSSLGLRSTLYHYMRSLRSHHTQILEDPDTQISRAQAALDLLKQKRQEIWDEISRYRSITHPIRRLPAEILSGIFFRCIGVNIWDQSEEGHRPKASTHVPWIIARTCVRWRSVGRFSRLLRRDRVRGNCRV